MPGIIIEIRKHSDRMQAMLQRHVGEQGGGHDKNIQNTHVVHILSPYPLITPSLVCVWMSVDITHNLS